MAKSRFKLRNKTGSGGFSVIEVIIAMFVFAVGILSLAALMCMVNLNTDRSRYMGVATNLATEKLEYLNRYAASSTDAPVTVGGNLNSDYSGYYDDVQVSSDNGKLQEVTYNPSTSQYVVFSHYFDTTGTVQVNEVPKSSKPVVTSDTMTFHRRWLVESPITVGAQTVAVRRITVWISAWSPSTNSQINVQGRPLTFQLSTVRP